MAQHVGYEEFPTWLVIERADGRIDDRGFVRCERLMPVLPPADEATSAPSARDERPQIRFSSPDRSFRLCVPLREEDYAEETGEILAPLPCPHPDGRTDRLWIGAAAHRFMRERGLLKVTSPKS
jgi:hypothetical protein